MVNIMLPQQDLGFAWGKYVNLKKFYLGLLRTTFGGTTGPFVNLDLDNIQYCVSLNDLTLARCFHTSSIHYGAIPLQLLDRPLIYLGIGDAGYDDKLFADNHLSLIATSACAATRRALRVEATSCCFMNRISCFVAWMSSSSSSSAVSCLSW